MLPQTQALVWIAILILLTLISICAWYLGSALTTVTPTTVPTGQKDLKTLAEVKAAVSQKEFIFVIGQPNCPHCEALKPVLQELAKNVKVFYMDHTEVRGSDVNELKSFYSDLRVPKILAKREGESEMHVCWAARTVEALQAHLKKS